MQQIEDVYRVGKQGLPAASPTSVLEEEPVVIASWSMWEPSDPVVSHHASPTRSSPLRPSMSSSMSSPLSNAMQLASKRGGSEGSNIISASTSTRSLVETLQNCLTSLPQSNMGDNGTAAAPTTTTARQGSSRPPGKRRPRATRRAPTTILETNPSEFRDMVQKLTGIPSAAPAAAPVRPHPQRASPTNLVRPETLRSIRRLPPISSPPRPPLATAPITFLEHLQRNSSPVLPIPRAPTPSNHPLKRESSSPPNDSMMKRVMSAPTTSMESWWSDNDNAHGSNAMSSLNSGPPFTMSSGYPQTDPIFSAAGSGTTASPDFAQLDSADGQLAQEEQEFSLSQLESWLSSQDHTSTESMRG